MVNVDPFEGSRCRFCDSPLKHTFVDLGMSPLCESYLSAEQLNHMEPFYPLHVHVCENCLLVQLEEYVAPEEIFTEYAYFSSYADSWLQHVSDYTDEVTDRFSLGRDSQVIEVASNDGYLLQYFMKKDIPILGIEPAANVARVAIEKGIPTKIEFFGEEFAKKLVNDGVQADLLIGNNVLSQVPNLNDFIKGMKVALKPGGVITMEFHYLKCLIEENQFDTIYHEHFSYFSFLTTQKVLKAHGLKVFDVELVPTHGGSLRIYACHKENDKQEETDRISQFRKDENQAGYNKLEGHLKYREKVEDTKRKLLNFLIKARESGKTVVGYGAPGKGNTLLNYCGIRTDFMEYTVDRNPYKQGKFLPGTRIPIYNPEKIGETKPDFVLILPWNFKEEIMDQVSFIRDWGGQFVVPIPEVTIIP